MLQVLLALQASAGVHGSACGTTPLPSVDNANQNPGAAVGPFVSSEHTIPSNAAQGRQLVPGRTNTRRDA